MDLYSKDTSKAWAKRLFAEWYNIEKSLRNHHGIHLPTPAFEIVEKRWGKYCNVVGGKPTIHLSRHLFNNYGWGAVVHVLKHEMAHMIVDVEWKMGDLDDHGKAFLKACGLIDVDPRRLSGAKDLLAEDAELDKKERIVGKIKKVMALTSSSEKGEAENALRKSEELMLKYNIDSLDQHAPEEYLFRPVGPVSGRMPNYVRDLANTISDFYFVEHIMCYCGPKGRYFEFFGTKENLDIAEYIFCCLLRQAEKMWKEHAAELKMQFGGTRGVASKNCFIEGLFAGYRRKLLDQREMREDKQMSMARSEALIWTGDPLMAEMYRKAYPNRQTYHYGRNAHGGGYGDGFAKGQGLSLNAGLHSGSGRGARGRLLNA